MKKQPFLLGLLKRHVNICNVLTRLKTMQIELSHKTFMNISNNLLSLMLESEDSLEINQAGINLVELWKSVGTQTLQHIFVENEIWRKKTLSTLSNDVFKMDWNFMTQSNFEDFETEKNDDFGGNLIRFILKTSDSKNLEGKEKRLREIIESENAVIFLNYLNSYDGPIDHCFEIDYSRPRRNNTSSILQVTEKVPLDDYHSWELIAKKIINKKDLAFVVENAIGGQQFRSHENILPTFEMLSSHIAIEDIFFDELNIDFVVREEHKSDFSVHDFLQTLRSPETQEILTARKFVFDFFSDGKNHHEKYVKFLALPEEEFAKESTKILRQFHVMIKSGAYRQTINSDLMGMMIKKNLIKSVLESPSKKKFHQNIFLFELNVNSYASEKKRNFLKKLYSGNSIEETRTNAIEMINESIEKSILNPAEEKGFLKHGSFIGMYELSELVRFLDRHNPDLFKDANLKISSLMPFFKDLEKTVESFSNIKTYNEAALSVDLFKHLKNDTTELNKQDQQTVFTSLLAIRIGTESKLQTSRILQEQFNQIIDSILSEMLANNESLVISHHLENNSDYSRKIKQEADRIKIEKKVVDKITINQPNRF